MGRLLYISEHLACPMDEKGPRSSIEVIKIEESGSWQVSPSVNKMIFILKGGVSYSSGEVNDFNISSGHIVFLPAGSTVRLSAQGQPALLLLMRIFNRIQFCDSYKIETLFRQGKEILLAEEEQEWDKPFLLKINQEMDSYLNSLIACHKAGLRCRYYNTGKIKEMFYILRGFYLKEDLYRFFLPAASPDSEFSQFVLSNYTRYRNLSEMAEAMNYTVSGFEKRFRRVFTESPYKWMMRQRAQEIFHHITASDMNFKQISDMFGFSTTSAFNDFVKKNYGKTPGQIRESFFQGVKDE